MRQKQQQRRFYIERSILETREIKVPKFYLKETPKSLKSEVKLKEQKPENDEISNEGQKSQKQNNLKKA